MFSFPRLVGHGGGICFYIKNTYIVTHLNLNVDFKCTTFEHGELSVCNEAMQLFLPSI